MDPLEPPKTSRAQQEDWMRLAIAEAERALDHDDVPIGAIVIADPTSKPRVIASRHNERELTGDPTAHAEVLALRDASSELGRWRLDDCLLVVTLEPCPMCGGALWASRIGGLVYGAPDMKAGATGSLYNLGADPRLNHEFAITHGVLADRCSELLVSFFAQRRQTR
ncbi:MAG: tRNA adenosine(34) deaminase TadA [Microthrixaceae bacterium]|nr:tRNA adenosine(34) deaminase TadA [Microthrixaceae bacterium]